MCVFFFLRAREIKEQVDEEKKGGGNIDKGRGDPFASVRRARSPRSDLPDQRVNCRHHGALPHLDPHGGGGGGGHRHWKQQQQ